MVIAEYWSITEMGHSEEEAGWSVSEGRGLEDTENSALVTYRVLLYSTTVSLPVPMLALLSMFINKLRM